MTIKTVCKSILFFSLLVVSGYCFSQNTQVSTSKKIKAPASPAAPVAVVPAQNVPATSILQDVQRVEMAHPQETPDKVKAPLASAKPVSAAPAQKETTSIQPDLQRIIDAHPQEANNSKIKSPATPVKPVSAIASKPVAATSGENTLQQDVKRVTDQHP